MNSNIRLSREILKTVLDAVADQLKPHTLTVAESLREAWVYQTDGRRWEFHYGPFYWHGRADNAYEARAKGWEAWLAKVEAPGYGEAKAC